MLSQENFFSRYFDGFPIDPTDENLSKVRAFCLEKWRERISGTAQRECVDVDLSNSCKFTALFGSVVFEADIGGNWHHVHNVLDGEIVDINADAADILALADPYANDEEFLGSPEFHESMRSCVPRVEDWIEEFAARLGASPRPA